LSDEPVAERLADALLELAVMHGVPAGHGGLIEIAPSVSLGKIRAGWPGRRPRA
jgi:hypothetical protein